MTRTKQNNYSFFKNNLQNKLTNIKKYTLLISNVEEVSHIHLEHNIGVIHEILHATNFEIYILFGYSI